MSDFSSIGSGLGGVNGAVNRISPGSLGSSSGLNGRMIEPMPQHAGSAATDRVELSSIARYLDRLREMPSVRQDLIAQVRKALEEGVYESDEKIDIAIERLADQEML